MAPFYTKHFKNTRDTLHATPSRGNALLKRFLAMRAANVELAADSTSKEEASLSPVFH